VSLEAVLIAAAILLAPRLSYASRRRDRNLRRRITSLVAAGAMLLGGAPARADVFDDNPAAASRGANDLWVFARRSTDGAILVRNTGTNGWSSWSSLGGSFTSGPAAAAYGPNIEVFARGQDGAVWTDALVNGAWTGWSSLGGYATSAPAAIARRGTPYLDLAVKGGDNTIYVNAYAPTAGWLGWRSLGGNLTSAPALDSHSDGILDVFSRGTDGALYQQAWNGSQWAAGWGNLGGGIYGAAAAVNKQPHDLDVYVRGAGNALYQNHWDSVNSWTNWFLVDSTPIGSSVAAVSDGAAREILFSRTGDEMYVKVWTNPGGWTSWNDFGPIDVPPPPAPPAPPPPQGEVGLLAGLGCTPSGGKMRVTVKVHKSKGKSRARVVRVTFFTRGKGRHVRVDHHPPWIVHLKIDKPAGSHSTVYARVYFRRSKHGKLHKKIVFRGFTVCA
jgi:hypothetical protein